jgi:hypothetical protein
MKGAVVDPTGATKPPIPGTAFYKRQQTALYYGKQYTVAVDQTGAIKQTMPNTLRFIKAGVWHHELGQHTDLRPGRCCQVLSAVLRASATPVGLSQGIPCPAFGTLRTRMPFWGKASQSGSGNDRSPKMNVRGIFI